MGDFEIIKKKKQQGTTKTPTPTTIERNKIIK